MTNPAVAPPTVMGPPDTVPQSLDDVPVSAFPITAPPFIPQPAADLVAVPIGVALDAGTSSCMVPLDGPNAALDAMHAREARYADHAQDVAPAGSSPGD